VDLEGLMNSKVPLDTTVRGWEFVRYCRAEELETAVLSGTGDPQVLTVLASLAARLRRSKNRNIVDELPYFSVCDAYRKGYPR
jgi:hypothetical protein